jgi:hypothetical protein
MFVVTVDAIRRRGLDAHPVSLAQMTNSSTNFQLRNAAPAFV